MQFKFISHKQNMVLPVSDGEFHVPTSYNDRNLPESAPLAKASDSFLFQGSFLGSMDLYSDRTSVAGYLDTHEGWFYRCAKPMQVEPLGKNGYILSVGHYKYFGYEVEPKIAVVFNPSQFGKYKMHTVPIPGYVAPGYEVVYHAEMDLQELDLPATLGKQTKQIFKSQKSLPTTMTRVGWTLDMSVTVVFPKFIDKLPNSLIQKTGDRLLSQIVRQISPRLTYKVQQDFHTGLNLPIPPKSGRTFQKIGGSSDRPEPENGNCAA